MKRILLVAAAVLVATAPAAGHAAPKPKKVTRTVTLDYTLFCGAHSVAADASFTSGGCAETGRLTVAAKKTEKYVTFTAVDQSGTPVGIQYWQNDDYDAAQYACDKGAAKTSKGGGTYDFAISVSPDCPGLPLGGTLTVKLSNLP